MPAITAGSKFLPRLPVYSYGHHRLCSRLAVSIFAVAAILATVLLFQRSVWPRLTRRRVVGLSARATSPTPSCQTATVRDPSTDPDSWVRLGQGLACPGKQANRTVSRGEVSVTAPVGLGGFRPASKMEDEERRLLPVGSMARGVGTAWRDETEPPSNSPSPAPTSPVTEQNDHVRTSLLPASSLARPWAYEGRRPALAKVGREILDHNGPGSIRGVGIEPRSGAFWDATHPPKPKTSLFGEHMIDDEHVLYNSIGLAHKQSPIMPTPACRPALGLEQSCLENRIGRPTDFISVDVGSTSTKPSDVLVAREPSNRDNFIYATRSGSEPSGQVDSVGQISTTGRSRSYANGVAIPSDTAWHIRPSTGPDSQGTWADISSDDAVSSSSYPSTSPLLPPPPPTTDYAFDPSAIMFPGPGAVIDGGIRIVPAHHRNDAGSTHIHAMFDSSGSGWKRHTRVYGGGVCLACAAAGNSGFYGASVRPEDKQ